jgi:uracil-DNA glycosylase
MDPLQSIAQEITACKQCPLHKNTTNAVPGHGNPHAKILFIGEAPGAKEDTEGIPFIGTSGKLLTELLTTIGIQREDIFITNVVKHRPPNNRDPTQEEVAACKPFLKRQIEAINPDVIVTLGNHALEFVTGKQGISSMHGKIFPKEIAGKTRKIVPTFHPAALIYNRKLRPLAEQDFQTIKEELGQKNLSSF